MATSDEKMYLRPNLVHVSTTSSSQKDKNHSYEARSQSPLTGVPPRGAGDTRHAELG